MSKPKEWNLEYTDRRRTMSWEVASHESHLTTKVIEKEAYSKAVEALKLAYNYHVLMLKDLYGCDVQITQPHTHMANVLDKTLKELGEL